MTVCGGTPDAQKSQSALNQSNLRHIRRRTFGACAVRELFPLVSCVRQHRAERCIEQGHRLGINQVIVDVKPILTIGNNTGFLQNTQLLRDVRLGAPLRDRQMADSLRIAVQGIQDLQAHRMAEQSEAFDVDGVEVKRTCHESCQQVSWYTSCRNLHGIVLCAIMHASM